MPHDPLAQFDAGIRSFLATSGIDPNHVALDTPADRAFGERSSNIAMRLARERRQAPLDIARELAATFEEYSSSLISQVEVAGAGFLNFRLNYDRFVPQVIAAVAEDGFLYGRRSDTVTERVVVEHTSVNPNKEWHIGHVRNAVLGDVVGRVLRLAGHDVQVQNYIDDTGLQAATAIHALINFPEEQSPHEKYDHYVGRLYVKISTEFASKSELQRRLEALQAGSADPVTDFVGIDEVTSILARLANIRRLEGQILETMHAIEAGSYHLETAELLDAQLTTAYRLGIFYDLLNWESHLVRSHLFAEAMERIGTSPRASVPTTGRYAGAFVIQTGPPRKGEDDPKCEVLVRSNGIPTYVGKDIAYHMWKFQLLPDRLTYVEYAEQPNASVLWSTAVEGPERRQPRPNRVINVIGVNQSQAQDAVKEGLRVAGFGDAADRLLHLAYGLVSTAEGKISGRKGTDVSADGVIHDAVQAAHARISEKRSQELTDEQMWEIADAVGVGAVRYFMVQYNPLRDIVFNVADVVSYDGNTGLYIQYALVRMFAILRRAADSSVTDAEINAADLSLLTHPQEYRLAYHLASYPELIATAARTLSVNLVAEYAYETATIFSQFYRDCPVMNAPTALRAARLSLVRTVRDALLNVCHVLGVPAIERL